MKTFATSLVIVACFFGVVLTAAATIDPLTPLWAAVVHVVVCLFFLVTGLIHVVLLIQRPWRFW